MSAIKSSLGEIIKTGMVAIVGPPNVGKSTLLNGLLGQKISIVSPKPQTTRNRVLGILNDPAYQIILLDTPGLHEARTPLNLEMVKIALTTLSEADVILFLIDVSLPLPEKKRGGTEFLKGIDKPAILALNKIDLLDRRSLLAVLKAYEKLYPFKSLIPFSALHNDGVDILLAEVLKLIPDGPRLYPGDLPTDASERFIAAEMIREQIFRQTGQEIPYSTAVIVDSFKENERKKLIVIHATIFVERPSQKRIIIGKGGAKLKQIGQKARVEIEAMLGRHVLLKLWIKVRKDWTRDMHFLKKELGF